MKYSIVMASYLGEYPRCARDRPKKFVRAVESVLSQTHTDWELIIVSDGCEQTIQLGTVIQDERVRVYSIDKQKGSWSPHVRNVGIKEAKGDYVVYLDTDDIFGPEHLEKLVIPEGMEWGYFNMFEFRQAHWVEKVCRIEKYWCGTGNLVHKPVYSWPEDASDYEHDWKFIKYLRKHAEGVRLATPSYFVCHVPYGSNVYDL